MHDFCCFICALLFGFCLSAHPANADIFQNHDDSAATIFAYNDIGEDATNDGFLRIDQFESHIKEIVSGDYTVIGLGDLVQALKNDAPLQPKTIALTFDNAKKSFTQHALPLLKKHKLPYTVFIATDMAENNNPQYLKWDDLKTISRSPHATLGIHGTHYQHLTNFSETEQRRDINTAIAKFRKKIGEAPLFFSYPYGEINARLNTLIQDSGFQAAFGQASSIAYNQSDLFTLPRFVMNEVYGDRRRFRMAAQALPLPVNDITPNISVITQNPPVMGFTLPPSFHNKREKISCFGSGQGKAAFEYLGESRIEVRFKQPFDHTRVRINCTLKTNQINKDDQPIWRWFGMLYHLSTAR